jgi:hypothetical protein
MRPTTPWQRGLQHFNGALFVPNSVDGLGTGLGGQWTTGTGNITHATVGTAYDTQFKRTIYKNAGNANDELGPRLSRAGDYQFWLGNDKYLGGWYLSAIFRIEAWNAENTARLFIGMTANAAAICTSDTVPTHTCGLWHDTTDGQDVLNFVFRSSGAADKTTSVTTHALNPGILAAGVTLLWEMWAFPNGMNVINTNWKLSQFDVSLDSHSEPSNRVKRIKWQETGNMINSVAQMMAPQVQMSNGAETVANRFGMSVANVYVVPWSGEQD